MVDVADSKSAGGDTVWVRAPPPVPNKQRPHPGVLLISCLWGSNPRALSKALGALCNPRWPAAHGRSSPTASSQASYRLRRLFMLCIKSHLALTPLLLLSESNPLRWALIRFLCPQNWLTLPNKQRPHRGCCLFLAFGARTRGLLAKRWERFATRGGLPHTAGRAPPPVPRRRKLRIACDDFLCSASKAISRALRCSSFPNRAHFVGLRFGYITLPYQNKQRPPLGDAACFLQFAV